MFLLVDAKSGRLISRHVTIKQAINADKELRRDVLRHSMSEVSAESGVTTKFPPTRIINEDTNEEIKK
jgi:hypothetical protein